MGPAIENRHTGSRGSGKIAELTIIDALYRELTFALCGAGGALDGLVEPGRVKHDMRNTVSSEKDEADYPWVIFRRITESEDNRIPYARERFEIEIIGLRSSATKGDAILEPIKNAIKDHFKGTIKTIGKFTADGTPDPDGGIRVKSRYVDTVEGYDQTLKEKSLIMIFFLSYIR